MLVPFLVSLELNEILYKQQHLSIVPIFLMLPLLALLSPSHYLQFDNHLQTGCHKHFSCFSTLQSPPNVLIILAEIRVLQTEDMVLGILF